jgi:flavoprotein
MSRKQLTLPSVDLGTAETASPIEAPPASARRTRRTASETTPRARPSQCAKCGRFCPANGACNARHLHGRVRDVDTRQLTLFGKTRRPRVSLSELLGED